MLVKSGGFGGSGARRAVPGPLGGQAEAVVACAWVEAVKKEGDGQFGDVVWK